MDAVLDQRNGPHPKADLFAEWQSKDPTSADRKIAEAVVLARLGALLHDLCHVPFGHSIEDDLGILEPHDANAERFGDLWQQLGTQILDQIPGELETALRVLILSKEKPDAENIEQLGEYAFVADVVGNTICADLLDYLARDHLFTGLPAKLGHRFIDGFYVTPASARYQPRRMVIKIVRGNRVRADVISELFKFLRYRYELSERALTQHAKLAADSMIGRMLDLWFEALRHEAAVELDPGSESGVHEPAVASEASSVARTRLEFQILRRGDDGLLEYLRDQGELAPSGSPMEAAGELANDLLDRRLFKPIARSHRDYLPMARQIHDRFKDPTARRRLEAGCALYCGLEHPWHIAVWLPAPDMRMKAARVLVDDDERILPLDASSFGRRGAEIYESHKALWAVSVFAHTSVLNEREVIRAWLAAEMGIGWAADDGAPGTPPLTLLAAKRVAAMRSLTTVQEEELGQVAAAAGLPSFASLVEAVDLVAQARYGAAPPSPAPARGRRRRIQSDLGLDDG